jgi:5-methylcytosine-specific restriction endonuclease McrA
MNPLRPKQTRLQLEPHAYQRLCRRVLARDGWKCQACGSMRHLQVHHKQFRSHSGHDSEENLITLCGECHKLAHGSERLRRQPD